MSEVIRNTSPIQYLHQLSCLHLLSSLARVVTVPPAVVEELRVGRQRGVSLPDLSALDWIRVLQPTSSAVLPLVRDLGAGETEVLALCLEVPGSIAVLDDRLARQVAASLGIHLTGTLGVILDAKAAGLLPAVAPLLNQLQALRFHLAPATRTAMLKLAGEEAS